MDLKERIAREMPELIEIRHDLHAHPELAYEEKRTSEIVIRELSALGIEMRKGLAGGTGVLGYLPATSPTERTIALRADMDALPILETTNLPYASQVEGKMHACGHDGHTTMLIGAARVLSQAENRPNNVVFVFQPAEEFGAGGEKMANEALEGVDQIFGLHGWPSLNLGERYTRVGAMMASADVFKIKVTGKGGHAAFPHLTVDPIVISAHVVLAIQTVASRNVDPLHSVVCTVTQVHAGTATNIIPDHANVVGTLRTLDNEVRDLSMKRIREIAMLTAETFGGSAEVEFIDPYLVTFNHPEAVDWFRNAVDDAQPEEMTPVMGAEDFSYYGRKVPACFFTLGLKNAPDEDYPGLHTPKFDFNDLAMPFGIESFCKIALHA